MSRVSIHLLKQVFHVKKRAAESSSALKQIKLSYMAGNLTIKRAVTEKKRESCFKSYASYFFTLTYDARGKCWWYGIEIEIEPLHQHCYILLLCERWQQRGSACTFIVQGM